MDRSLGTTAQPRIQDVSPQIDRIHQIYGASDYTNPGYASSNRSLNYHLGGSIHKPENERVTVIPYKLKYNDSVGLFGSENHFVRIEVQIDKNVAFACFEEEDWECARMSEENRIVNTYQPAVADQNADLTTVNTYEPVRVKGNSLNSKPNAYVSVDLVNLKTGNQYIDSWLDIRLYTKNREEHPYDKMYVRLNDFFYIGFHARNTKRLPYNVECTVGAEYLSGHQIEDRYKNQ